MNCRKNRLNPFGLPKVVYKDFKTKHMKLAHVIKIEEEKCVNCHQCISACPVKFANDGSDKVIHVNHDLCIGCGECIHACTHDARIPVDDFDLAMTNLQHNGVKTIAVVAPAVASNFPDTYLHLNGWLKSLGVSAVFDVSFGAELTIKSYLEYIRAKTPKAVIAQPCPAIVSYIQIYKPELLPYLAPADSPMLHTMKMIRNFYPQYKNHKILVVSPCTAKRREFDETQLGDNNVTITRIKKYLEQKNINLLNYPDLDYDNDPAERAVLFSSPGGLMETAARELPDIRQQTRKTEGVHTVYNYLNHLQESIEKGVNPLIIDCLNCELGCNGGTGTPNHDKSQDELEHHIHQRKIQLMKQHKTEKSSPQSIRNLHKTIDKYWKPGIYSRTYVNHSENYRKQVKTPTPEKNQELLHSMHKYKDEDIKNCASCGYNDCNEMAKAIYNGFNRKENCHFFLDHELKISNKDLDNKVKERTSELIINSEELLEAMQKIKSIIG